uniref:Uncharacterized protein n=1 Tax=Panstrongylus lignarius TaxID=156445 RepID=A0A224XTT3_9HEMI
MLFTLLLDLGSISATVFCSFPQVSNLLFNSFSLLLNFLFGSSVCSIISLSLSSDTLFSTNFFSFVPLQFEASTELLTSSPFSFLFLFTLSLELSLFSFNLTQFLLFLLTAFLL